MTLSNFGSFLLLSFIFTLSNSSSLEAQDLNCQATTIEEFYECYGGMASYTQHRKDAISTFIQAEDAIHAEDYEQANILLQNLFMTYPKGENIWWNVFGNISGGNVGTPTGYYGLRMMEDIVDHHLNTNTTGLEVRTVNMTVLLVGCSEGIQPTTLEELAAGTGPFVTNTLDPALLADDYRIVRQSYDLFTRYVHAITKGEVEINVQFIETENFCLDVSVNTAPPFVASGNYGVMLDQIPDEVKDSTDFFVLTYPSHVPQAPAFDNEAFITGGMGGDSKGGPVFIADDQWIVRKPAHLGAGLYSDIERRIYLPQWYQHEFFHHLFGIYPEYELEVDGHDWFNQIFWPADFEGQFETDFYAEALHKRLQTDCVPLSTKLITRIEEQPAEFYEQLSINELLGEFSLDVIENDWHEGVILQQGSQYFWKNTAGVQWEVFPNIPEGKLETGADCPYPGEDFFLEFYRNVDGSLVPGMIALKFQSGRYVKRFGLMPADVPIDIAVGNYTRSPYETMSHSGDITKLMGTYSWQNDAGENWSLEANAPEEQFLLDNNSPTPGEVFQMILFEGNCEYRTLGFQYINDFYWRDKLDPLNESPTLVTPIADVVLNKNYDPYVIDISATFSDVEGDEILLFASSDNSALISPTIENGQLTLTGGAIGDFKILVVAVDANGGVLTDEFNVQVIDPVSTSELEAQNNAISIYPNPTRDHITVKGHLAKYKLSINTLDGSLQRAISTSGSKHQIDLSDFSSGVYIIRIEEAEHGRVSYKKVVKL